MPIEIKFKCQDDQDDYLIVNNIDGIVCVEAFSMHEDAQITFNLDITTAIKLSKTIRTEINKAKEVNNV